MKYPKTSFRLHHWLSFLGACSLLNPITFFLWTLILLGFVLTRPMSSQRKAVGLFMGITLLIFATTGLIPTSLGNNLARYQMRVWLHQIRTPPAARFLPVSALKQKATLRFDEPWRFLPLNPSEPCRPSAYLRILPARILLYERVCQPKPGWREIDTRFYLADRTIHWYHPPLPTWARILGLPILLAPKPELSKLINDPLYERTQWPLNSPLLHPLSRTRHPISRWHTRLRHMILFFALFLWLFITPLRFYHRKEKLSPSRFFTDFLLPSAPLLAIVTLAFHFMDSPWGLFNASSWTFKYGGPLTQTLGLFILWGIWSATLTWSFLIGPLSRTSALQLKSSSAVILILTTLGIARFYPLARRLIHAFIFTTNPEFTDLLRASLEQIIVRAGLALWLITGLAILWWLGLTFWRLRPRRYALILVLLGIALATLIPESTPAFPFAIVLLTAPIALLGQNLHPFLRVVLPAFACFYALQPMMIHIHHNMIHRFIENDMKGFITLRQASATADIAQTRQSIEKIMIRILREDPGLEHTIMPSAARLWMATPLGRSRGSSLIAVYLLAPEGRPLQADAFRWQIPEFSPPPIDWKASSTWIVREIDSSPELPIRIQIHERMFAYYHGWIRVIIGTSQLYWAPWDARPDAIPTFLHQTETRSFQRIVGPFLFGAWTRDGVPLARSSWFLPFHPDENPHARSTWSEMTTWFGERLDVFSFGLNRGQVAIAVRAHHPIDFLLSLPIILAIDLLIAGVIPFQIIRYRRRVKQRSSFQHQVFTSTLVSSLAIGFFVILGSALYLTWEYHEEAHEKTIQTLNQAEAFLRDYVRLTGSPTITDSLLEWLSHTFFHDVDLYTQPRLLASSRRAWFQLGLLPLYEPPRQPRAHAYLELPWLSPRATLQMPLTVDSFIQTFRMTQIINAGGLIILLTVFVGFALSRTIARLIIEPIDSIRHQLATVTPLHPEPIIVTPVPDEFQPMLDTLNRLIRAVRDHEDQLQLRIQMMEEMLSHVREAVLLLSLPDYRILYWNPATSHMFNWPHPPDLSRAFNADESPATPDFPPLLSLDPNTLPADQPRQWQMEWNQLWFHIHWLPLTPSPTPHETTRLALLMIQDLTETRRAAQLDAWREMARHVAHAVKNPLTPLQLYLDQMDHYVKSGKIQLLFDKIPDIINKFRKNLDILRHRLQEFNLFSRSLEQPREWAPVNLVELLRIVLDLYPDPDAGGPRITLHCETPQKPIVMGNREMLHRTFQNLIENAMETGTPDIEIRITIRMDETNASWLVLVENTGPPIPDEILDRLFEPYFTTKQYGSGLGLALCRRYIDLHGGTIHARNGPRGPIFEIRLPVTTGQTSTVSV